MAFEDLPAHTMSIPGESLEIEGVELTHDERLRSEALFAAIQSTKAEDTWPSRSVSIVERAKVFEAYIAGKETS